MEKIYKPYMVCIVFTIANTAVSVNTESTPAKIKNKTGCLLPSLLFNKDLETKNEYKKA